MSNLVTGPSFMSISSLVLELWQFSFIKGLTRNPEILNTSVWVLSDIWRLGRVMDTKFCTNVSNRILLNAAKYQGYSLCRFWVIKGKPTGGGGINLPPLIRDNNTWFSFFCKSGASCLGFLMLGERLYFISCFLVVLTFSKKKLALLKKAWVGFLDFQVQKMKDLQWRHCNLYLEVWCKPAPPIPLPFLRVGGHKSLTLSYS